MGTGFRAERTAGRMRNRDLGEEGKQLSDSFAREGEWGRSSEAEGGGKGRERGRGSSEREA